MTKKQCPLGEACDLTIAWMAGAAKAQDQIKAQAAEIERLRGAIERGLSGAKDIEKSCRGLRDEAQPITAKDAARKMIAELTGANT